ncbi:hypothetical protein SAMN05421790_103306 [Kroppenstedtia eburnea]|uniref:YmaF family protein n=1 Tax=Kroppenstedtia eburnea TaxID=714067 RepID=A0A1N7KWQ1_9BACL|nr:hypothetical protein SAMN05421790_103306 [Kroppenstedtia eburnea]
MSKEEQPIKPAKGNPHKHEFKMVFYEMDGHMAHHPPVPHAHPFKGETSFNVGHLHHLAGRTAIAEDTPGHVHHYRERPLSMMDMCITLKG